MEACTLFLLCPDGYDRTPRIMNRYEKNLLRTTIQAVAHHNANAWWELKRQMFEGGYQSYYPMQGEFRDAVSRQKIA